MCFDDVLQIGDVLKDVWRRIVMFCVIVDIFLYMCDVLCGFDVIMHIWYVTFSVIDDVVWQIADVSIDIWHHSAKNDVKWFWRRPA